MRFPKIDEVAANLRAVNKNESADDGDDGGIDVRLQVYPDGNWAVRWGDSSYDQDHRGYWGSSSVPGDNRRFDSKDLARELIDQAKEHFAQGGNEDDDDGVEEDEEDEGEDEDDEDDDEDEDEEDDEEDDFDLESEMEDALIVGDARGNRYSLSFSGKHIGDFGDFDEALAAGIEEMHRSNYFPNIFYVNERGNTDLLTVKYTLEDGKPVNIEDTIVRSWV